jgi:hypothetical protein
VAVKGLIGIPGSNIGIGLSVKRHSVGIHWHFVCLGQKHTITDTGIVSADNV